MKQLYSVLFLLVFLGGMSFAQTTPVIDKGSDFTVNPKPHNITPSAMLTPIEEIFGSNANAFSGGPMRARGNFFTCTTSRRVIEHRFYINPVSTTNLYFCIYEGDTQVGTYNQISAVLVSGQGPGEGWYSSGAIDVTLTAGKYYVIYTQMEAQATYFNQQAIAPFPVPCSFGEQTGGAGWATGSVPTYGDPPPATQTFTSGAFVDPVAYYQTIVTDDIGGGNTFFEDFEGFIAGQQVACQDPINWTTWPPATPCDLTVDPYISTNYAYSGANSAVIVADNDLVHTFGDKTSGVWYIRFMAYVPATKSGYFNTLAVFTPPSTFDWGMECYFDVGGTGRLTNVPGAPVAFTYPVGSWFPVDVMVDLDATPSMATVVVNNVTVLTWDWTQGATVADQLAANDFYGAATTDEMYFDDYYFSDQPFIPVELTSFTAVANNGTVNLTWTTATEVNNQGFEIERRNETSEFNSIGFVQGSGTTTEQRSYSYLDQSAEQGVNYYRLKQIDFDGTFSYSDEVAVDVTSPIAFDLGQNYPNPFNPSTNIKYSVPEAGNVKIAVYNLVGEEVAILVDGFTQAGTFEVTFDASNLSSGVYLYKLQSANSVMTKKMMLLK